MKCVRSLAWGLFYVISIGFLISTQPEISLAQANPCAAKATKQSQNPCAAKNPCSAKNPCGANPCAPGGKGGVAAGKAVTVRGEVAKVDPGTKKIVLKREGGQLDLAVSQHSVIRDGVKVKSLKDLKPGEKVMVSYVDTGKERTAWYIYSASAAAMANPCAGNPCAAKNPCAANPCAVKATKGAKNPCAANPCAAKNPCAPKGAKGR
jgi:Cu/Ag efflux protein CusF